MSEHRCSTCGTLVRVVSSDEGTSYYEPVVEAEVERLRGEKALLIEEGDVFLRNIRERDVEAEKLRAELADAELMAADFEASQAALLPYKERAERAEALAEELAEALRIVLGYGYELWNELEPQRAVLARYDEQKGAK